MMNKNPFISKTFAKVWETHFNTHKPAYSFDFIKEITFAKTNILPVYINVGKNLTKGISYILNKDKTATDYKNKTFLVFDVPKYFDIQTKTSFKNFRVNKIKQYPGYLINLKNYIDFNDYFKKTFSKSSVQKFSRYKKRLETCFDIKEKMLIGDINKTEYDFVFNHFNKLLTKRFEDKQITNNNLNPDEWAFYYDVAYPMILENKAALHVIYNNETPISVRLLYFSESIIFDAITVFDIDYSKFHIGKVALMKMLEWSFKSDYKTFDFSKGYFDYKESWSDLKYDFEYHVFYDSKSMKSFITANFITSFFKLKQYLRDKEINKKLHQLTFLLKKEKSSNIDTLKQIQPNEISYTEAMLTKINIDDVKHTFLKKYAYDFLFLTSEHINNLKVFKFSVAKQYTYYVIKGKSNQEIILSFFN